MPDWPDSSNFEFLSGGYGNQNFRFSCADERYVLRVPGPPQPGVNRQHEADWYRRLPDGLGVIPCALDPSGLMITPWIEAVPLADAVLPDERRLATYLSHLHARLPDAARPYPVDLLLTAVGIEETGWNPQPSVTCHNDLNPWNILVDNEGTWHTIDWESVGSNDALFDLVTLHQGLDQLSPGKLSLENLATEYLGEPADAAHLERNLIMFWRREGAWAANQLEQGNDRAEIANQFETSKSKLKELGAR